LEKFHKYHQRSNGRELEEGSIGKEVTDCVGVLGPIGCDINGGGRTRGMPP
jgi:hypothetical protein